jgi:hypothetical protein
MEPNRLDPERFQLVKQFAQHFAEIGWTLTCEGECDRQSPRPLPQPLNLNRLHDFDLKPRPLRSATP